MQFLAAFAFHVHIRPLPLQNGCKSRHNALKTANDILMPFNVMLFLL